MSMKYYKALTEENKGPYSDFDFSPYLPKNNKPGKWLPKVKALSICESGWHYCNGDELIDWLNDNVYEVKVRGKTIRNDDKSAAQEIRLVKHILNQWDVKLFLCDCAEHVLHFFEDKYPDDKRPREAIEAGRKYARHEIDIMAMEAAGAAAGAAAMAAAAEAAAAAGAAWAAEKKWKIKRLKQYISKRV
jgi:hypothetical protein